MVVDNEAFVSPSGRENVIKNIIYNKYGLNYDLEIKIKYSFNYRLIFTNILLLKKKYEQDKYTDYYINIINNYQYDGGHQKIIYIYKNGEISFYLTGMFNDDKELKNNIIPELNIIIDEIQSYLKDKKKLIDYNLSIS